VVENCFPSLFVLLYFAGSLFGGRKAKFDSPQQATGDEARRHVARPSERKRTEQRPDAKPGKSATSVTTDLFRYYAQLSASREESYMSRGVLKQWHLDIKKGTKLSAKNTNVKITSFCVSWLFSLTSLW